MPAAGSGSAKTRPRPAKASRTASVAQAKASLPALLREVEENHIEITVLRRNVPVARIAPVEGSSAPASGFGWMRGSVEELGDIVGPTGEAWDLDDEDLA
ncbi:MAG TPA: type II toxin-antitoxin system Phd/YefM family antitoxin [Acidobacteriaceae bacterium]|nr:type II toxin-antitoxin system Phd/YefM family antitoxin [Acidobacteriaceae bacterium]